MANRAIVTYLALEMPSQNGDWMVLPIEIAGAEAFGVLTLTPGPVTISPPSIATSETFGHPRWVGEGDPPAGMSRRRGRFGFALLGRLRW